MFSTNFLVFILFAVYGYFLDECNAQTHPLYRCTTNNGRDHFVSRDVNCEGHTTEWLLGYALDAPLVSGTGTTVLYRCLSNNGLDHFTSTALNCEGNRNEGILGYLYTQPPASIPTLALYRCVNGSDHFVSFSSRCDGHVVEGRPLYIRINP